MSPEELTQELIELFPSSKSEFQDEEMDIGYKPPVTYHRVWMSFSPVAFECLSGASEKSLLKFASILNREVSEGRSRENAASTCFLEHSSQIRVSKIIKPFLSKLAESELR
ncbi:MAG: hypothetical protein B0W54_09955 [Cellvibrio sp. 79]|nr:MAG: hypothetical protein B0W54_09955 [Cellvibrio sp. 79]